MESYFLSSRKSMLLFRASFSVAENYYWKEGELILKEKHFSAGGNQFFLFSCQKKQFVLIAEMYILTNALFRVVEIDFLVNPNHFLHISSETSASDSFSVYWKRILERILHSGYWRRILSLMETVYSTWKFCSTSGNCHWYEWDQFLKTELIFAGDIF